MAGRSTGGWSKFPQKPTGGRFTRSNIESPAALQRASLSDLNGEGFDGRGPRGRRLCRTERSDGARDGAATRRLSHRAPPRRGRWPAARRAGGQSSRRSRRAAGLRDRISNRRRRSSAHRFQILTARVSMEEVLVAAAYAGRKDLTALEMVRQHGDYLIAHLRVAADGRPLDGRVVKVPAEADGRPVYEIEYRIAGGAPARIAFRS